MPDKIHSAVTCHLTSFAKYYEIEQEDLNIPNHSEVTPYLKLLPPDSEYIYQDDESDGDQFIIYEDWEKVGLKVEFKDNRGYGGIEIKKHKKTGKFCIYVYCNGCSGASAFGYLIGEK